MNTTAVTMGSSEPCTFLDRIRGPKVLDMSVFDWVSSLLGAVLLGVYLLRLQGAWQWVLWLVFWVLLGVVVHAAIGTRTMLGYYLGINPKPVRRVCA